MPRGHAKEAPEGLQAPAVIRNQEAASSDTCTVACNLPNGLELHLFKMAPSKELVAVGTYSEIEVAQPLPEFYVLNGARRKPGESPNYPIVMGYALTSGIPRQFMDRWLAANASSALVQNRCLFITLNDNEARAEAKDHKGIKSGLEPLQPPEQGNDPRWPKRIQKAATTDQDE